MPIKKIVYKCKFNCDKQGMENEIIKHEKRCLFNPENKTCHTCEYFSIKFNKVSYIEDIYCFKKGFLQKILVNCPVWKPAKEEGKS